MDLADIGDAMSRIGGGTSRIKLHCHYLAAGFGFMDLFRFGFVGQVQNHQGFKAGQGRCMRQQAFAVGQCLFSGLDRRHQVGHGNRPAKHPCGMRHCVLQHLPVSKMHMPVIGA